MVGVDVREVGTRRGETMTVYRIAAAVAVLGWASAARAEGPLISEADSPAVFAAAGFKKVDGSYKRCEDDVTASYMPGFIEEVDLNKDGQNEAFVRESSLFCYGNVAEAFALVAKDASGTWVKILDEVGVAVPLEAAHNGWQDIEVGGPGSGPFPVFQYDGKTYVAK